jgi:hypothetical protein
VKKTSRTVRSKASHPANGSGTAQEVPRNYFRIGFTNGREFTASFNADTRFLGLGLGGGASFSFRIAPRG